jgi:HK97 family phage major capsid protein/HK97 family phage prohead protease
MEILRKVTVAEAAGADDRREVREYVISDGSLDRYGTVINPSGWDLTEFRKNPIAFFNHDKNFPIGTWENMRVESGRLLGQLRFAAEGTSSRIDEIIQLVRQGIIKAVSIGMRPKTKEPLLRSDGKPVPGGIHYTSQELLEASLVGVGGNANALQVARSLNISDETIDLVFGKHAGTHETVTRGSNAEHGTTPPPRKASAVNITIAQRISDAQTKLVALRDDLTRHLDETGDEPDDAALAVRETLNGKIETAQRNLDSLEQAEKRLASTAVPVVTSDDRGQPIILPPQRPFAVPAKKVNPADHVMRSIVAQLVGHATRVHPSQVLAERYGEDGKIDEATRTVFEVVTRAASAPATTTTSGWASQLVETSVQGFTELLMPASVLPGLAARGLRLNFGRAGVLSIPTRTATPTIAGSFVAEGAPIPVRQGAFSSQTFTPKKLAVISTFTREIAEHSTPAIEGLIRNAMQEDTSVAVDTVLLDATAASTTRPAGLRNGVATLTATAGGGFAALVGDIRQFVAALITASNGNLRQPVWIMNDIQALSIATTQNAGGDFPFAMEINNQRFQGYPVILSSTVTAGMVLLVDAADFIIIEGGAPRFDVSDQATLHLEDTTPLAIGTAGAPATVAAPVRSLFQTDSMALRMIMDLNWGLRRAGVVAWTTAVTW